ncbi:MAG: heme lyase CcmF/NrfE family subunit [Anaerolineae bacterium]|nr:heme lyase CcmF/NrfE family subunit [Anaerolineae bacterium]
MIGYIAIGTMAIALVASVIAVVMAINGLRAKSSLILESSRLAALCSFPLLSITMGILLYLLLTNHFEYAYVYETVDINMPVYLKIAALWGGQAGSLLFWCWLLSLFEFLALINKKNLEHDLFPWVTVITSVTLGFFVLMVILFENPFLRFFININEEVVEAIIPPLQTLQVAPKYGLGMNPLLYHPGMVFHPPALYLGFVGFVIPFAYAIAALIAGREDSLWIRKSQKWSLVAWLFLSLGLILGSRWAYDVLGWGGYWGWDPVEVAALMPWLTSTAYLHSSLLQEKRGIFKQWSAALIILTFCLVILGTFLTRSGLLSSVHAFSASAIGPFFFAFTAVMLLISVALLGYRWQKLKDPLEIKSYFSRESLFLFNNLVFVAIFLICLLGVLFPILSELVTGQQINVGPQYYKNATGPLFAILLALMGLVPLSAWSASSGKKLGSMLWKPLALSLLIPLAALLLNVRDIGAIIAFWLIGVSILVTLFDFGRSAFINARNNQASVFSSAVKLLLRNRRKYGAYIIHIGVALMALGVVGIEFFQSQTQVILKQNESVSFSGYSLTYRDLAIDQNSQDHETARSVIEVLPPAGSPYMLYPERDYYYVSQQSVTLPGLSSTPVDDLYITLVDWLPVTSEGATFKIYRNPLVFWLWVGSLVLVFGTLLALWPKKYRDVLQHEEQV